jgi:hypothetical protein
MSVNAAGSAQNVQQALNAIRQNVQAEQVVAAVLADPSQQASQQATQQASQADQHDVGADNRHKGLGAVVDVKA